MNKPSRVLDSAEVTTATWPWWKWRCRPGTPWTTTRCPASDCPTTSSAWRPRTAIPSSCCTSTRYVLRVNLVSAPAARVYEIDKFYATATRSPTGTVRRRCPPIVRRPRTDARASVYNAGGGRGPSATFSPALKKKPPEPTLLQIHS